MSAPLFTITLPFPPSLLSGHNTGHWRRKSGPIARWKRLAWASTLEVKAKVAPEGDINIHVRFVPPNKRGDRTNYANRCKPVFDGIALALKVNDRRFVPSYEYAEPEKPGRLEITIGGRPQTKGLLLCQDAPSAPPVIGG